MKRSNVTNQCVRIKANGMRCGASACVGTTVCAGHGGNAPQVKAAAGQRLVDMLPQALDNVKYFLQPVPPDPDACPLCRRGMPNDPVIVAKMTLAVLDRTGYGPTSKVEVEHKNDDAWVDYCTREDAEALAAIIERAEVRMLEENAPASIDEAVH